MNCPQCGREMEQGYLYVHQAAIWTPTAHKMTFFLGKKVVDLTEKISPPAHICRDCRKVTVEY